MKSFNFSKIPASVYRLQFNEHFSLKQAIHLLPYLHQLGIDGVYCSPLFEAASSSGYDVTNPHALNPALGSPEDYEEFCAKLQTFQIKQVFDVVPNHMGIKKNPWWIDVLEFGQASPYAGYFHIAWYPQEKELINKVLLPVLGERHMEKVLKSNCFIWFTKREDFGSIIKIFDSRSIPRPIPLFLTIHLIINLKRRRAGRNVLKLEGN